MSKDNKTFLELVEEFARDIGEANYPTSVTGQTGVSRDLVEYIQEADIDIQKRHDDWRFLWAEWTDGTTAVGSQALGTLPSGVREWDREAFVYDPSTNDYRELVFWPWDSYRREYEYGVTASNAVPEIITEKPDGTLKIWPPASAIKTVRGEYWKSAVLMTENASTSVIPATHRRIIVVRAKLFWSEQTDAPEIYAGAASEWEDLLVPLEAEQLPAQEGRRSGRNRAPIVVEAV